MTKKNTYWLDRPHLVTKFDTENKYQKLQVMLADLKNYKFVNGNVMTNIFQEKAMKIVKFIDDKMKDIEHVSRHTRRQQMKFVGYNRRFILNRGTLINTRN